jgi:hypothetical protein
MYPLRHEQKVLSALCLSVPSVKARTTALNVGYTILRRRQSTCVTLTCACMINLGTFSMITVADMSPLNQVPSLAPSLHPNCKGLGLIHGWTFPVVKRCMAGCVVRHG